MTEQNKKELYNKKKEEFNELFDTYSKLDIAEEIKSVKESGIEKKYLKKGLSGDQRKDFSIEADKQGLVAYNMEDGDTFYFIIGKSRNENHDVSTIKGYGLQLFNKITGISFKHESLESDLEAVGKTKDFQLFIELLNRYGISGLKRLYIIIEQKMISEVQKTNEYQEFIKSTPVKEAELDKPYTIARVLYNPENDEKIFISLDITAAIFVAYNKLDIIKENTWGDFISKFTSSSLIAKDKKFRSSLFGKLEKNKSHGIIINNTIIPVWNTVKEKCPEITKQIMSVEGDEIVIRSENHEQEIKQLVALNFAPHVKICCFKLNCIKVNGKNVYVRNFIFPNQGTFDIKCAGQENYIEAYTRMVALYKAE
jgi:hypothetical protein